jgi:phosphoribosyl-AMP cyclohydrolase
MKRDYFLSLETLPSGHSLDLSKFVERLAFNDDGLIPVITQDNTSQQVLMFAWMNAEALTQTLTHKRMTYWSRSRQQLWVKGETSGHSQQLVSMSFDCDGDAILCSVNQTGGACHTGRSNCFYLDVDFEEKQIIVRENPQPI